MSGDGLGVMGLPGGGIAPIDLDDSPVFDEPCAHGCRVGGHSVYCFNGEWADAPRKCSWRWGSVGEHERCPGYKANPNMNERCRERGPTSPILDPLPASGTITVKGRDAYGNEITEVLKL